MIIAAVRIYLLANLVFLSGIAFYWFPDGILIGLFSAPFSFTFSAPLIFLLAGIIWLLNWFKASPVTCWLLFLSSIAAMTYLPFYWFDGPLSNFDVMKFIIVWGYASAFISILALRKSIHRFFLPAATSNHKTHGNIRLTTHDNTNDQNYCN